MSQIEMTHSPAPWRWEENVLLGSDNKQIIHMDDDGACGDPDCCGGARYWIHVEAKDKPLIAAAPDLLAYAKLHEGLDNREPWALEKVLSLAKGRTFIEVMDEIRRAAILRAEGK